MSIPISLLNQVLALPPAERARLANRLLLSLEPDEDGPDPDHKAAWAAEIEARLRDIERGACRAHPVGGDQGAPLTDRLRPSRNRHNLDAVAANPPPKTAPGTAGAGAITDEAEGRARP